ncbi:hypothetical protein [Legionella oakridgensis]|uniref:Uncharacterized protein n=2 Tax=Legionella oakridgensis TaxID=29423 RepID=W0B505_9GAMM|nr:hypothetical protein [Legionella oakridgensis]AHE65603.1 hypothetical protein Loa_00012 [Legionella oakridgensis ATCC 33761 = DSM 21215]ETO94543.1 hypothetical protein LOR_10c01090 [Legionella oakridgensis RV-2-2007]KTD38302.1 hypothetical protein Loak_1978 [Legionella oakridgensis]STY15566.1 Uncharacterised protein [Legionella longbeachae]
MNKCYLIILLFSWALFIDSAYANKNKFVSHSYNIESINQNISDKECQELYSEPIYYTIQNDKPIYELNHKIKIINYQRLQTTFLNDNQRLFLGRQTVSFTLKGKTHQVENILYFILDRRSHTTQGGWYSPGFCKGNLIGMELGLNEWRHPET